MMKSPGLSENIRDAYSFLCHNYAPGDEIILVGFSRGAYTARCLANLIYDVGILTKRGLTSLDKIYNLWENHLVSLPRPDSVRLRAMRKVLNWRSLFSSKDEEMSAEALLNLRDNLNGNELYSDVRVKACAVWDTVASLDSNKLSFVGADLCPNIDFAFQALALNEERLLFQPLVWEKDIEPPDSPDPPQTLKQCWFLGDHSNIGGGNEDNTVAGIPLYWMIAQLVSEVDLEFEIDILKDFAAEDKVEEVERAQEKGFRFKPTIKIPFKNFEIEGLIEKIDKTTWTETKGISAIIGQKYLSH